MRGFKFSDELKLILKKLAKKDKSLFEQLDKKIKEIVNNSNIEHYKNLRHDLKDYKRVHIGHFVLVFQYDRTADIINFEDFDHHDIIYKNR